MSCQWKTVKDQNVTRFEVFDLISESNMAFIEDGVLFSKSSFNDAVLVGAGWCSILFLLLLFFLFYFIFFIY